MSRMNILDMTSGNRSMWFERDRADVVFVDIRREVHPSVIADSKALPFQRECFDIVVFDPPHTNLGRNSDMSKTYGYMTGSQITNLVAQGSTEAARVARPGAVMGFKWSDRDRGLESTMEFLDRRWEPLFGQRLPAGRRRKASNKITNTHWVLFRVAAQQEKEDD